MLFLDVGKGHAHAGIGHDEGGAASGFKTAADANNLDVQIGPRRCGIQHVQETAANAEVTGAYSECGIGGEVGDLGVGDERITGMFPAVGVQGASPA